MFNGGHAQYGWLLEFHVLATFEIIHIRTGRIMMVQARARLLWNVFGICILYVKHWGQCSIRLTQR